MSLAQGLAATPHQDLFNQVAAQHPNSPWLKNNPIFRA
jgi:hypothetical protein